MYAIIYAGGGGTRLWPKSLEDTPKQFLKIFGSQTLIEITADRLNNFLDWDRIYVVTTSVPYGKEVKRLLPKVKDENVIVEPERKDSAAAHALGAIHILRRDPNAVIINTAADHFVSPLQNFKHTMLSASRFAFETGGLVATGIKPTYPHTGLGHIKRGKKFSVSEGRYIYKLDKFVEKPQLELAKKYTESGEYFWNACHFVWRADSFMNEVEKYAKVLDLGMQMIKQSLGKFNEMKVMSQEYKKFEKISVEYAIAEKSKNFFTIISDYSWTDIGDWNEVWKNLSKDENGNVVIDGDEEGGDIINIDTSDALIHKDGRMIAIIDVDNIIVVDTPKALLICAKSKAQNVKKVVELLKENKRTELL